MRGRPINSARNGTKREFSKQLDSFLIIQKQQGLSANYWANSWGVKSAATLSTYRKGVCLPIDKSVLSNIIDTLTTNGFPLPDQLLLEIRMVSSEAEPLQRHLPFDGALNIDGPSPRVELSIRRKGPDRVALDIRLEIVTTS